MESSCSRRTLHLVPCLSSCVPTGLMKVPTGLMSLYQANSQHIKWDEVVERDYPRIKPRKLT